MSLTDICKGHKWIVVQNYPYYMPFNLLIESINSLAGLKAGILCSGTITVVFLLILRAVFLPYALR